MNLKNFGLNCDFIMYSGDIIYGFEWIKQDKGGEYLICIRLLRFSILSFMRQS